MAKIHPLGLAVLAAQQSAHAADLAYSDAVIAQFGPTATRWNCYATDYNDATEAARQAKCRADDTAWSAVKAMRAAGATVHPMEEGV